MSSEASHGRASVVFSNHQLSYCWMCCQLFSCRPEDSGTRPRDCQLFHSRRMYIVSVVECRRMSHRVLCLSVSYMTLSRHFLSSLSSLVSRVSVVLVWCDVCRFPQLCCAGFFSATAEGFFSSFSWARAPPHNTTQHTTYSPLSLVRAPRFFPLLTGKYLCLRNYEDNK